MSGLDKNRVRNQTICFRVSPEERIQIEARIQASGLPKGRYFIQTFLEQDIQVISGKYQSDRLSLELKRLRRAFEDQDEPRSEVEEIRALLTELLYLMKQENQEEKERPLHR